MIQITTEKISVPMPPMTAIPSVKTIVHRLVPTSPKIETAKAHVAHAFRTSRPSEPITLPQTPRAQNAFAHPGNPQKYASCSYENWDM